MLVQVERNPMAGPCKHSPAWRVSDSELFGKRKLDCDAKDLVDTQDVFEKQFELDWQRVAAKQRFLRLIETTDKTKLSTSKQELARGVQAAPLWAALYALLNVGLYWTSVCLSLAGHAVPLFAAMHTIVCGSVRWWSETGAWSPHMNTLYACSG